jgi:hypothetical protein
MFPLPLSWPFRHHRNPTNAAMIRSMPPRLIARFCAVLLLLLAAAPAVAAPGWRVVLVAGDNAEPVFDNAVAAMARWLVAAGVAAGDIHRLSAAPTARDPIAEPASASRILHAIAAIGAQPGDRCLVFITSHGQRGEGVWLAYSGEFLQPAALAQALSAGCGAVPTVVVISACYSGAFGSGAMRAPNRVILTAARADRPSFGCQANRTYTVFDECLLDSLSGAPTWRGIANRNLACVREREKELNVPPSQPQVFFGAAVRNLAIGG